MKKRLISMLLVVCMALSLLPVQAFAALSEHPDWEWSANMDTLYIKDGAITKSDLYSAMVDKAGTGSYKYAASKPSWGWDTGGTIIADGDASSLVVSRGSAAVGKKGSTSFKDWTGWGSNSSTVTFNVEYYYVPSVSVTGKDGMVASDVTAAVIHGQNVTFNLSAVGEEGWVATVANASGSQTVNLSATEATPVTVSNIDSVDDANITVTIQEAVSYKVNVGVNPDTPWGTASVDVTSGVKGTEVTVTATPNQVNGGNTSYSVAKIEVNGTAITGNTFKIGDTDANVVVTFAESELEVNADPEILVNGYDKDTITGDLKEKLVTAVLKNPDAAAEYTVSVYLGLNLGIFGNYDYVNLDDAGLLNRISGWIDELGGDFWIKVNDTIKVKIVDKQGRTVEVDVATKESRDLAEVSLGTVSGSYDTLDQFKAAVTEKISVLDNDGNDCKANAGLTVTLNPVAGKTNTYTVSYTLSKDGKTWLKTSGTLPGEVVWNVNTYKVTFLNDDGTVLSEKEYPYGTTADKIDAPTATKADKVDENGNVMVTYTFDGWTPDVNTVTGEVTYTATFTEVVKKYTITWVNGGETTTTEVAYGETPVAPTATKSAEKDKNGNVMATYTGTWPEIATVTGEATYTATFTRVPAVYEITWVNGNETTTETYEYGAAPVAPTATKADLKDADGNVMATYTFTGWDPAVDTVTGAKTYTAKFTEVPAKYTVTWIIKGEETTQTLEYGKQISHEDVDDYSTVDANYYFEGWKVGNSTETIAGSSLPTVTGDVTITAVFSETSVYTVTVVYGNGTESVETPVSDKVNYKFTVPAAPDREGYSFDGWYIGEEKVEAGKELTISEDTTITAKWTINQYTITFDTDGGSEIDAITGDFESAVTAPADPTKPGYTFTGWDKEIPETMPAGDVTITATWKINSYNAIFDANGGAWGEETTKTVPTVFGETPVAPADPVYAGHAFRGWAPELAAMGTEDVTYTAQWVEDVNGNNVDDALETITIKVNKVHENDAVTIQAEVAEDAVTVAGEEMKFVFDSTAEDKTIIVKAAPVVIDNASATYVAGVKGAMGEGSYSEDGKFVYTYTFQAENFQTVEVTFAEAAFDLKDDPSMRFYQGMEDPEYESLYKAVVENPEYNAENVKSVKYLARPAATYSMQVPVLFEREFFGYPIKIGGNTVELDLGDAWLDVGESFKTLTPEELQAQYDGEIQKIKDKIAAVDLSDITWANAWDKAQQFFVIRDELTTLIETITNEAQYMGYHKFGAGTELDENGNVQETLQVIYENEAMRLVNESVKVTLEDDRTATVLSGGDLTFEYDEYTNDSLLSAISLTDMNGNAVDGEFTIAVDMSGKNVGEYTYTVTYEGSWDYKPVTKQFTLTVVKAPSSMDVPNLIVTHGDDFDANPVITNKHGNVIDADAVRFVVGLDVAELDIDGDGVRGIVGQVQLMLPEGILTSILDGEYTLSELMDLLNQTGTGNMLEGWNIPQEMVDTLNSALESIADIAESGDLKIIIGGDYPTDIGAYLTGAVTSDGNYETSFDVGYLVIKPDTTRVYLDWNYNDTNGIFTPELLQHVDLGASAFNDEALTTKNEEATAQVNNLFFGINAKGDLVTELFNAENGYDPEQIEATLGNGGYTQLAFIAEFGNQFYYAVPAIRAFAIVPNTVDVNFVGDTGENHQFLRTFNNQPQALEVEVTSQGRVITPAEGELTMNYVGLQTNGKTYESTEAPVHAGAYLVTATYTKYDERGEMVAIGANAAMMVIQPAESTIDVAEQVVAKGETYDLEETLITVDSVNTNVNPDTTVISAAIASDNTFAENGWEAIEGKVNVDFPRWLDEILSEKFPTAYEKGVTAQDFITKINAVLPELVTRMEEEEISNEVINSFGNLMENITKVLAEMPEDVTLTFDDDIQVSNVGAYAVVGIVTDSDHYPAADVGVLVIAPAVTEAELEWTVEDENAVITLPKLTEFDFSAYATVDGVKNDKATAKIQYLYIGITNNGQVVNTSDPAELVKAGAGAYTQIAYIADGINGDMDVAKPILRSFVTVPQTAIVEFEDANGNNTRVFTYTGEAIEMPVNVYTLGGQEITGETLDNLTITYIGIEGDGEGYNNTNAPAEAGIYTVIARYQDETRVGMNMGVLIIEKAEMVFTMADTTVTYNGEEQFVEMENPENADALYLIVDKNGEDGVVNLILEDDLTALKAALEEALGEELPESGYVDLKDFKAALEKAAEKINGLDTILDKIPADGTVVINGDLPVDVGTYDVYGLSWSANYKAQFASAQLTIEKAEATVTVYDQSKVYGEADPDEWTYEVEGLVGEDTLVLTTSRDSGEDVGAYAITAALGENPNYDVTVVNGKFTVTERPATITMGDLTVEFGTGITKALLDTVTYKTEGFLADDLENMLISAGCGELNKTPEVGSYPLFVNADSKVSEDGEALMNIGNYKITCVNGTLTVTAPAQPEVTQVTKPVEDDTAFVYTGAEQTYTVAPSEHYTVTGATQTNAGTYEVTVSLNENCVWADGSKDPLSFQFVIAPKPLTVTVGDGSMKVDGNMAVELDKVAVNFAGVVAGDENEIAVELSCTAVKGENGLYDPGDYDIKAVVTDETGNYDVEIVYANGQMHISTLGTVGTPVITYDPFNQQVVIDPAVGEEDATIYYSVDNGETWTEYTDPIEVTEDMTIQAYATKPGMDDSDIATLEVQAVYTVTGTVTSFRHNEAVAVCLLDAEGEVVSVAEVSQLTATEENANLFRCTYTFQNIPAGEYTLEVSKKDHVAGEFGVEIDADAEVEDVKIWLLGDVDMDGMIGPYDASLVLQYIAEKTEFTDYQKLLADTDFDNGVGPYDASLILQYIAEKIPGFYGSGE